MYMYIFLYIFYYLSVFLFFYLSVFQTFCLSVLLCFYLSREEKKQEKQRKREKLETEEGREDKERRKQKKKKKEEKRRQEEVKNLWLPFWKIARDVFYFCSFFIPIKCKTIYINLFSWKIIFFIKNASSFTSHNKLWNSETVKLILKNLWMLTLKEACPQWSLKVTKSIFCVLKTYFSYMFFV